MTAPSTSWMRSCSTRKFQILRCRAEAFVALVLSISPGTSISHPAPGLSKPHPQVDRFLTLLYIGCGKNCITSCTFPTWFSHILSKRGMGCQPSHHVQKPHLAGPYPTQGSPFFLDVHVLVSTSNDDRLAHRDPWLECQAFVFLDFFESITVRCW